MLRSYEDINRQLHPNVGAVDVHIESPDLVPTLGSEQAAGYDIKSKEDYVLKPGERRLFRQVCF